jgi:hypothetical protein
VKSPTDEDDLGVRADDAYFPGGIHSIHFGQTNIKQNHVWLELLGVSNRFASVRCFSDSRIVKAALKKLADYLPEGLEIINYQDFYSWHRLHCTIAPK